MIASLLFFALLSATDPKAGELEARAAALRADLAVTEQSAPRNARAALERQLLTSLERRRDMEQALADAQVILSGPKAAPQEPPRTLLEADDIRRDMQQLDASIDAGTRRLDLLRADRDAAAQRLTRAVAARRALEDSGEQDPERIAVARLDAEFAESSTAELDMLQQVVDLQQAKDRSQREALNARLAAAGTLSRLTQAEVDEIDRRIALRTTELQQRLAAAAKAREAAHRELQEQAASASPAHLRTLKERLATSDISIELTREATANLTIEQSAWQFAIRYWRDGDPSALIDAEQRGPVVRASLERHLDFMKTSSEQLLTRQGALDTQIAQAPDSPDAAEWKLQRAELDQQLRLMQGGISNEHRTIAFLERLRDDFNTRISAATVKDRMALGWFAARKAFERVWNFEVFTVEQTVEVDGRQTSVPRGVTVAKIVKAPLLLLIGLYLAFKLTGLLERFARKRGVDEASARLTRRWTLGLLTAAVALSSLAIAGIPLAAFAFIGGAVAIGVGFGMQTLFKNLISGAMVLIERPFRLGDEIEVGDLRGTVVDIDLRASVVRDGDGSETLIPNSVLVEQNVRKMMSQAHFAQQSLGVVVDPASDPRTVMETMRNTARRHGQLIESQEPIVSLDDFGGQGLRFMLQYWTLVLPSSERKRIASDLRLMILGAFTEAGIRFPPPPLEAHAKSSDPRAPSV